MQDNLTLLSDRSDRHRLTPANLLDELSVKIKSGQMKVEDLAIVYLDPEGTLGVHCTPMPRYKVIGLLQYASTLEVMSD